MPAAGPGSEVFLKSGDRLPDVQVQSVDGDMVSLRTHSRLATVLLALHPDCGKCSAYRDDIAAHAQQLREWDGRVLAVGPHAASGIEAPSVLIADQWGELAVVENAGEQHEFIEVQEVIDWLRFLATKCPECEGEAL